MISEVEIFKAPRESASVFWISSSEQTGFITVVNARHSRQTVLKCGKQLYFFCCRAVVLFSRHHRHDAGPVMAPEKIERSIEILRRIVFRDVHHPLSRSRRAYGEIDVVEKYVSNRIVHRGIELITHEVFAPLPVADLVTGVFPYFSKQKAFRVRRLDPCPCLRNERIREFIRYIESPARRALLHPVGNDSILSENEIPEAAVVLIYLRQILNAPPAFVAAALIFIELVPVPVRRIITAPRSAGVLLIRMHL